MGFDAKPKSSAANSSGVIDSDVYPIAYSLGHIPKKQTQAVAYCNSRHCYLNARIVKNVARTELTRNMVIKPFAKFSDTFCSECDCALFWQREEVED